MGKYDKQIWDQLMEAIENPYGVAAIMGNLQAESSMDPMSMTGKQAKKFERQEYADAINSGSYTKEEFAHDGIAYGLVQWLFWSRKAALYDYTRGKNIADPAVQIGYLLEEMPKYKAVWPRVLKATTIAEASDAILESYERPATINDAVRAKRAFYGFQFFEKFWNEDEESEDLYSVSIPGLNAAEAAKLLNKYPNASRQSQ